LAAARRSLRWPLWWRLPLLLLHLLLALLLHLLLALLLDLLLPLLLLPLLLHLLLPLLLLPLLLDLLLPLLLLALLLDLLLPLLLLHLLLALLFGLLLTLLLDLGLIWPLRLRLAWLRTGDRRARRRQRLSSGSRQRPSCHRLAGLRRLAGLNTGRAGRRQRLCSGSRQWRPSWCFPGPRCRDRLAR
jgi:hypothetical protein